MFRPALLILLAPLAVGGCFRHRTLSYAETAALLCPPPPAASTPAALVGAGPSGMVAGEVVDALSGKLVSLARVTLLDSTGGVVAVDTLVTRRAFALQPVAPGPYTLVVIGLAYRSQRLPVTVPTGGGLSLRVSLDRQAMDECPGFAQATVRRPWWQWWYPP